MSVLLAVFCATCEEYGPELRRSGSVQLIGRDDVGDLLYGSDARLQWTRWLNTHEDHQLELQNERVYLMDARWRRW